MPYSFVSVAIECSIFNSKMYFFAIKPVRILNFPNLSLYVKLIAIGIVVSKIPNVYIPTNSMNPCFIYTYSTQLTCRYSLNVSVCVVRILNISIIKELVSLEYVSCIKIASPDVRETPLMVSDSTDFLKTLTFPIAPATATGDVAGSMKQVEHKLHLC